MNRLSNLLQYECLHFTRKISTWIILALCFLAASSVFKQLLGDYLLSIQLATQHHMALSNISNEVIRPFWGWMLFFMALIVPLAPMMAISLEKSNGSANFWIVYRFSFSDYLLGKWLAWVGVITFTTLMLCLIPLSLCTLIPVDLGLLFSGWFTVWLASLFILTLSFLINLIWPYPALAFGMTYGAFLSLAFLPWLCPIQALKPYLHELSFLTHSYGLMHGRLYLSDLLYFLLIITGLLGLCFKRAQYHFNHLQ